VLRRADAARLLADGRPPVEGRGQFARRALLAALAALPAFAAARAQDVTFEHVEAALVTGRGRFPLHLELARTPGQRSRGLMFRRELAPDAGMLFDFGGTGPVAMWMKDTYVSLDMLFLDAELRVVWIHEGAEPLSLATIRPPMPVAFVLELPAGSVGRYGIEVGSRLEIVPGSQSSSRSQARTMRRQASSRSSVAVA